MLGAPPSVSLLLSLPVRLWFCLLHFCSLCAFQWICLSLCLFVYVTFCQCASLSICLPVYLLSVCLSTYLPRFWSTVYLSVSLPGCRYAPLPTCLRTSVSLLSCLLICLPVCPCVYWCVCPSMHVSVTVSPCLSARLSTCGRLSIF